MSLRTAVQTQIIEFIESGKFNKVVYNKNKPTETLENVKPIVIGNETGGAVSDSSNYSSRMTGYALKAWRMTFIIKFPCEVDITCFITEQLSNLRIQQQGLVVSLSEVTYTVEHPVTGGPQTGTQMLLNITATTRR